MIKVNNVNSTTFEFVSENNSICQIYMNIA